MNTGCMIKALHDTEEPIQFSVVKRYPSGMPWVPLKNDEVRPNNGRMVFALLSKADQKQRVRDLLQEIKDTSGMTKHMGKNAWMMEMQSGHKANDSMEIKRTKDKDHRGNQSARQHDAEPGTSSDSRSTQHQQSSSSETGGQEWQSPDHKKVCGKHSGLSQMG